MKNVAIIGSGSWGTALGIYLRTHGHNVKIWSFSEEEIKSSLRVSFDYGLDESEVEKACDTILAEYIKLWEKVK